MSFVFLIWSVLNIADGEGVVAIIVKRSQGSVYFMQPITPSGTAVFGNTAIAFSEGHVQDSSSCSVSNAILVGMFGRFRSGSPGTLISIGFVYADSLGLLIAID